MRRRTRFLLFHAVLIAAATGGAAPADAGLVSLGRGPSSAKCASASVLLCQPSSYVLRPDPPLPSATTIDPINGATFTNGRYMFVRFDPPVNPYPDVQGFTAKAFVDGSTGSKFDGFFCRTSPDSICYGGVETVASSGTMTDHEMQVGILPLSAPQSVRFAMRYKSTTGAATVNDSTYLHADVFFYVNDERAPTVTLDVNGDGSRTVFGVDDGPTLSVTSDADDNTQVASHPLTVDGGGFPSGGAIGDGVHSLATSACDIASPANCTPVLARTITFDSLRPAVSLPSLAPFKTLTPTIPFDVADPPKNGYASGVGDAAHADPVLYVDGAPRPAQAVRTAQGFAVTPTAPLAQGTHDVGLVVHDGVGNESLGPDGTPVNGTVTVDTQAPVIAQLSPADNQVDVPTQPTISAAVADTDPGSGIAAATLSLDGQVVGSGGDGTVSYTPQGELTPGRHAAEVTARDAAGNVATSRWSFTVKAAPGDAGAGDVGGGLDDGGGGFDDGGIGGEGLPGDDGSGSADGDSAGGGSTPVGRAGLQVKLPRSAAGRSAIKRGIRVRVSCARACKVAGIGRLGRTSVAGGHVRLKSKGTKYLVLRLTKAGRNLVKRKHPARLTVVLTARAKTGHPATVKRTVRLTY
jgi:hypothetical protein